MGEDYAAYEATVDLKGIDRSWTTVGLSLFVYADTMSDAVNEETFGQGYGFAELVAYRNQSKDAEYANRVKPYVGSYIAALMTTWSDATGGESHGVTTVSVVVDAKGKAKLAGTFADGATFSASSSLTVIDEGDDVRARFAVSVAPNSLAQGAMWLEIFIALESDDTETRCFFSCPGEAVRFVRADNAYTSSALGESFAYAYSSLAWVDASVDPEGACLLLRSDNDAFEDVTYGWKKKNGKGIVGVDKLIDGPKGATFKIDDKTGLFSGTCGIYKIFGAMEKGCCSGIGTAVGKDGSIGSVRVEAIAR